MKSKRGKLSTGKMSDFYSLSLLLYYFLCIHFSSPCFRIDNVGISNGINGPNDIVNFSPHSYNISKICYFQKNELFILK